MSLNQYIIDTEAQLNSLFGGATTLSNVNEHIDDPFTQSIVVPLAGLVEIEKKIASKFENFDIREVDCSCLDIVASMVGYTRRTNKKTTVQMFITGSNGTEVPTFTLLTDDNNQTWQTDYIAQIDCGVGFTTASSVSNGYFPIKNGELKLITSIDGVDKITNGVVLEQGYLEESCEQFRNRILSNDSCIPETEDNVINQLLTVATHAKFVNDYPDCNSDGCVGRGFVVRGGSDFEIASIIRRYAPINYASLIGNISQTIDCEQINFIRPCPVGLDIEYTAIEEVNPADIVNIVCSLNNSLKINDFKDIPCMTGIKFKTRHVGCYSGTIDSCDTTINMDDYNDCPCNYASTDGCLIDAEFKPCVNLKSWEYPVVASITYLEDGC